jgi:high-affinity nickel permease
MERSILDNFGFKQIVILVCLLGIVGSAAVFANSVFDNANAMISAAIGSGMFILFISLTAELMIVNLKNAIIDQKHKENDELIATVVAKSVYRAIQEEKEKPK